MSQEMLNNTFYQWEIAKPSDSGKDYFQECWHLKFEFLKLCKFCLKLKRLSYLYSASVVTLMYETLSPAESHNSKACTAGSVIPSNICRDYALLWYANFNTDSDLTFCPKLLFSTNAQSYFHTYSTLGLWWWIPPSPISHQVLLVDGKKGC